MSENVFQFAKSNAQLVKYYNRHK